MGGTEYCYAYFVFHTNRLYPDFHQLRLKSPHNGATTIGRGHDLLIWYQTANGTHTEYVQPDMVLEFKLGVNDILADPSEMRIIRLNQNTVNYLVDDPALYATMRGVFAN